MKTKQRTE